MRYFSALRTVAFASPQITHFSGAAALPLR
jgi:hypothetical protein